MCTPVTYQYSSVTMEGQTVLVSNMNKPKKQGMVTLYKIPTGGGDNKA